MNMQLVGNRSVVSRARRNRWSGTTEGGRAANSTPAHGSRRIVLRSATPTEATALHSLIESHLEEGRLLPRQLDELTTHAPRFIVAVRRGRIVGCAELAPLSVRVAEVRSLVVDRRARSQGVGRALVGALIRRARAGGFEQLCAFAHEASFFMRIGFSLVPHPWVPEKIARDCAGCALFRRCGQHALVLSLDTRER